MTKSKSGDELLTVCPYSGRRVACKISDIVRVEEGITDTPLTPDKPFVKLVMHDGQQVFAEGGFDVALRLICTDKNWSFEC